MTTGAFWSPKWATVPFGAVVVDGAFGPRFPGADYSPDGNLATLRTTDLSDDGRISYATMPRARLDLDRFADHLLQRNDLVISRSGTCGIAAVFRGYDVPVLPGAFLIRCRLSPDVESQFYRYFFNSPLGRAHVLSIAHGAVQQNINLTNLRLLPVPKPPRSVQEAIVAHVAAYDDLIENCERRVRLLDEMARALYREWFVLFRYPGHEKVPLVESPVGPIPKDWEVKRYSEVVQLHYGKALKSENRRGGNVPVYASSGLVGWHDQSLAAGPGIVLGRKGNVGSVYWSDTDFFVIDTAYYVTSSLPLRFVYFDLQGKNFINCDAAVPGLSREQAYGLDSVVPPRALLVRFAELAEGFGTGRGALRRQADNLRRSRDLLLPRLLSGELSVEDAA